MLGFLRRGLSVAALVVLDVAGLSLGLMAALVLRTLVYGDTVFWSLLWEDGPGEWLPFLAPITVLVFFQAGLYAARERRSGSGRVVSSLVLVALIVLAFGLGTDYDFTTTGLIPTAVVTCALSIALLRAAYESLSLELLRVGGIRRRVVLVGDGESLQRLQRELTALAAASATSSSGRSAVVRGLPPAPRSTSSAILERVRPDELMLTEADFDERTVLDVVERAHAAACGFAWRRTRPSCSFTRASTCRARACRSSSCGRRC